MLKSILSSWCFPAICGFFIFSSYKIFKFEINIFLICIFVMMIIRDVIFCVLGRKREKNLSSRESDCVKKEEALAVKEHSIDRYIESTAASRFQSAFNSLTSNSLFPKANLAPFLEAFKNAPPGTREYRALTEDFSISNPSCSVTINSKESEYSTTLNSCTCDDFKRTKKPCKHMYFLALHLGALSSIDVDSVRQILSALQDEIASRRKEIDQYNLFAKFFKELNSKNSYSSVTNLFAELEKYRCNAYSKVMLYKRNPAIKSAEKVSELSKEKSELVKQAKEYKFKLDTVLTVLPEAKVLLSKSPKKLLDANAKSDLLKRIDVLIHDMAKKDLPTSSK